MGDHLAPDELVPRKQCADVNPHEDHYWREDGKRMRYLDDPTCCYCLGVSDQGGTE